jgi:hypothetical protein
VTVRQLRPSTNIARVPEKPNVVVLSTAPPRSMLSDVWIASSTESEVIDMKWSKHCFLLRPNRFDSDVFAEVTNAGIASKGIEDVSG